MDDPVAIAIGNLGGAERQLVVEKAAADLRQFYVDAAMGQKMADGLLAHERQGDYARIADRAAFAGLLLK